MATTQRLTSSGIEIKPVYGPQDVAVGPETQASPGEYPFTRGIYPQMYRERPWTMRQYAGFATPQKTNERFKFLLRGGQTGLSVAFDLPTQMGYDSDHAKALGEVGRTGVAISSLADMEALFDGIPLDQISTSMTINATAPILLLLYELVGEKQGIAPGELRGTIQNDILKEYAARGAYIYSPQHSMRLVTDSFAYCNERLPRWHPISISGYHMREAGCTAAEEIAFTLSNAIAYVEAAISRGMDVDVFAPRLSFFFACHMNFFEEIAKFRAARRIWAKIMRDQFGATKDSSMHLRFHTQTGGATLTAQEPENNIVRTAFEALAAVLGGTQSLHTNSYDEGLSLPSEKAAKLALRTQQVLAFETSVTDTADPLGGSWYVESLTGEMERAALALMKEVSQAGGAVRAIEQGLVQGRIEESAYAIQRSVDEGKRTVVGVNRFVDADDEGAQTTRADVSGVDLPDGQQDGQGEFVNSGAERLQIEMLRSIRSRRDSGVTQGALRRLREAALGSASLLPPMREALSCYATLGEVCDVLREVFGVYVPEHTQR